MKYKKVVIAIISILVMIGCMSLSKEANVKYICASMIYGESGIDNREIIFSKESGFYNHPFELRLYAPTEEIYYTLDGSDPDYTSIKYKDSIFVKDASENPNVYSSNMEVTARFLEDEVMENCGEEQKKISYVVPKQPVDKCNVIKAVYYDKDGKKSKVEEMIYFVGFQEKTGYEGVNIISITTNPENLFDYEKGIYVLGKKYDEYSEGGIPKEDWKREYWNHWNANYKQRGIEWERQSHIQVFDDNGRWVLSQDTGIRIQGGGSRGFLPKSLNIYARDEYGNHQLNYDFFGTGYYPKRVTLSNGGDDYYTKIKDCLVSQLSEECNFTTMNYVPYHLFLNGEYWGFYYLTEKYDAQYIEHYYGVDKGKVVDDIIIIKNNLLETGIEGDKEGFYDEMQACILEKDLSIVENYENVCEVIDISSFIDYFAVEGYIARSEDWPNQNFALWRSRNISNKKYEDGKWRWMLFDVNSSSMSYELISHDIIATLRSTSDLFDSLCENSEFKKLFSSRLIELSETIFEKEYVNQKIDEYVQLMNQPIEKHYQRFFGTSNQKYYDGIQEIRTFFNQRKSYVFESIRTNFGEEYLGAFL